MAEMICSVNESVSGSIQHMPKVYFCCHPDDFEEYFEKTKREIDMIFPRISFWYYDRNEEPDADDVNRMNLIVIIVTNRFLEEYKTGKYSCYKVLKLAEEKHIPQLPLLQEGVPEEVYTMVFGHSQYLSKTDHGAFAIPYEEKLKKRLSETLLNDEEIKKIENAFLATIFLSYRKKDRKFVHKIMELIHSNEKFQDVGIWYDEFLTPGEKFDKEIEEALAKSDLFALMVTSNLLEKGNYVMKEEYPQAVKNNLPILPIKCAQTDEAAFRDIFREVADIYSVENETQISEALHKILQDKMENTNAEELRKSYLIGMAYLYGVYAEKNGNRAVELLSKAAEFGCDEAYERLVTIYHNGDGITAGDPELEIIWQRKYVNKLKAELSDETSKKKLLQETKKLAECIFGRSRLDEAKAVYIEALALLEELKRNGCADIEACEYQLYSELGDSIRLKACDLKQTLTEAEVQEARKYYLTALNMCGKDVSQQAAQYTNLAGLYYQLAEFIILGEQDNREKAGELLKEAQEYCQKALDIQKELMQKSPNYDTLKTQSILSDKMAGIYRIQDNYEEALPYFNISLEIWKKFKEDYPTGYHEEGYALARYNCAETLYNLGKENDAEKELVWIAKSVGDLKDKKGGLTSVGIITGYRTNYLLSIIYESRRDQKKYNYYANAMKKYEMALGRIGR